MPPIWHPKDAELIQSWIDAIIVEASEELSDWETGFIDSVQDRLLKRGSLTEAQEQTLERIYAHKTR